MEIVKAIKVSILSIVSVTVLVLAFSYFCYYFLIDQQYFRGLYFVPWIAVSYIFWGGYILFAGFYFHAQKTKFLGKLGVLTAVLNVIMNYVFISLFGTFGAALATLVSFIVVFAIVFLQSKKLFYVKWFGEYEA